MNLLWSWVITDIIQLWSLLFIDHLWLCEEKRKPPGVTNNRCYWQCHHCHHLVEQIQTVQYTSPLCIYFYNCVLKNISSALKVCTDVLAAQNHYISTVALRVKSYWRGHIFKDIFCWLKSTLFQLIIASIKTWLNVKVAYFMSFRHPHVLICVNKFRVDAEKVKTHSW